MKDAVRERAEQIVAHIEAELDDSISLAQQHRMLMGYVGQAYAAGEAKAPAPAEGASQRVVWYEDGQVIDIVDTERSRGQMRKAFACMLRELEGQSEES